MPSPKSFVVVLASLVFGSSPLLAICNNCEPNPSSSTYGSTALSRPMLANGRGRGDGPEDPVVKKPASVLYLGSSSYSKAIPILHLAGRNGLDVDLTLVYNSRVWTKDVQSSNKFAFNADRDWPAPGFRLGFGFMEFAHDIGSGSSSYTFTEPSGSKHAFALATAPIWNSTDSTYMQWDATAKVLTDKGGLQITFLPFELFDSTTGTWVQSGTLFRPTKIEDTNGNYISISYVDNTEQSIDTITDTLGRAIHFTYTTTTQDLAGIQWNGQTWAFTFNDAYPLKFNFSSGTVDTSLTTGSPIPVLTGVVFPIPSGQTNGAYYTFSYGDWGIVNQIANYSAGGALRNSVAYDYQDASTARPDFPTYGHQTIFDGVLTSATTYQITGSSSNPTSVTITDPSTSTTSNTHPKKVVTNLSAGQTSSVQVMDATTGTVLRTTAYIYISDAGGINSRPSQITSTLENGQQSKTTYTYTTNGNVATRSDYDFSASVPIRTTAYTYAAIGSLHILDRISQVLVKDGSGNIVAETDLNYDEPTTALVSVSGGPGHDDTAFGTGNITRGNLTSTTTYTNAAAHTGGNTRNMSYDTVGNLRAADLSCCNQKTWTFSSATQYAFPDSITKGSSPTTLTTSTTYYPNTYLPNVVTDENGQTITYTYDSVNRLTTVTRNVDGKHFYTTYDDTSALPTTVQSSDVNSAQQKVQTDGVGKPLRSDLYNSTTLISSTKTYYDELGRAYKRSNPFGPSESEVDTTTAFDALGRPVSVTPPSGGGSAYSYSGNSTTVTDPAGRTRRSFKDAAGRLVRVDEPGWNNGTPGTGSVTITGGEQTIGHWTVCDPKCVQLGGESVWIVDAYDSGTVTLTIDSSTSTTVSYTGSNSGSATPSSVAYALAQAINADANQLVTASASGATISLVARWANASTNFPVSITSATNSTRFTQPSFAGNGTTMTGATDPAVPGTPSLATPMPTVYIYDALSDLANVYQWPQTRTYLYDSLGELTSASVPETGGTATTFTYTTFGGVSTRKDPRNITTTYAYDTLNRLHTITYSDSTPTVTYNYGTTPASFNNGRILSYSDGTGSTTFTYNALGRITKTGKAMGQVNYNIQYSYNPAGQVTKLTYPSGRAVNRTYDTIGRLATIADATSNYMTITPGTDYNSAGQLKHFAYGNGVVADFGYNDHFETTSIRYSKTGSADLLNLTYNYGTQNDGEIASITDSMDPTHSASYTYDAWARLSTAQAGPNATPTWKYSYDYDRFGNRKNQNLLAGTTGYNTQLTIDPNTNHVTGTANTYDAAGNMTGDSLHTYAFDAENRIKSVDTTAATYSYDATNIRAKKVVGSATTLYIYNGSSLIAEYAGGAAASSPSKEYIGGGGSALASVSSGIATYYHADLLSTRVETNATGGVARTYGHLPFGEDWYETGSDKWKFTSYERDAESQLNYAMNRFNSGRYGRFTSMDPLAGSIGAPQSLNHYAYAENDPVNRVDPTGLLDDPACNHTDAGCGGMDSGGMGGWDFGYRGGGDFGSLARCGINPYCIQGGGIGINVELVKVCVETVGDPAGGVCNLEWLPNLSGAKSGGTSIGPISPGEKQQTEEQKQAQSHCAAKALAAGGMAALSNYVPFPPAARPSPPDYESGSALGSTAITATGDFLAAGGKAVVSVGLRNARFALVADVLDEVPFLGEAVMVIQAGKAAYDGVNAMIETMDQCNGVE